MTTQNETPLAEVGERLAREKAEREAAFQAQLEPWRKAAEARKAEEEKRRQAAEAQKAEALRQAAEAQFDRKYRLPALVQWRSTGGSVESFEERWPELRERIRADLIAKEAEQAPPRRNPLF